MPMPSKICPECLEPNHVNVNQCKKCGHRFHVNRRKHVKVVEVIREQEQPKVPVPELKSVPDEQVLIQEMMPPNYSYMGRHTFVNVEMKGPGTTIFVAKSPTGKVFSSESLSKLSAMVWHDVYERTGG